MTRGTETRTDVDEADSSPPNGDDAAATMARIAPQGFDSDSDLPVGGRLVWIPPGGKPREVRLSSLRSGADPTDVDACPHCGDSRALETVVREHVECGHVGVDGFVRTDGDAPFVCPKCGTADESGTEFDVVATVVTCASCGRTLGGVRGRASPEADR